MWDLVATDALKAIELSDKYVKAYFWLVKSLVCIFFCQLIILLSLRNTDI